MIYRALYSAASGMQAYLFNLDVIANNMANTGTTAYKRSRTNFEDVYYQNYKLPGALDTLGFRTPLGTALGLGVMVSATQQDFSQGNLMQTGRRLDVAIQGNGFMQVQDTNGILYTRNGQFAVNDNGDLVVGSANRGRRIDPPITIPNDTTEISISPEGIVSVMQPGSTNMSQVGQLLLTRFINPEGLLQEGESLYSMTDASGPPIQGQAGQLGLGVFQQNYLELSNAEPVTELVDLIKTQRNVELNSQVVQASDQLLQLVSNLRRY